jgi:hypothetical protein
MALLDRNGFRGSVRVISPVLFRLNEKKLTTAGRKQIKASNFALPGSRYPIHDISHARNALSRVSANGTPSEKAAVRRKVYSKYPGLKKRAEKRR